MLDINFIRKNLDSVRDAIKNKQSDVDLDKLIVLDDKRRDIQPKMQDISSRRNELARAQKGQKPSPEAIKEGKDLKEQFETISKEFDKINNEYTELLHKVPNIYSVDTPIGASEADNEVTSVWGKKPEYDFEPKDHVQIAEINNLLDIERGAKVAGSRFAYIKGGLVRLQMALMQFTIDQLTDTTVLGQIVVDNKLNVPTTPFELILPPVMLNTDTYAATARLKPEEVTYKLSQDELWLTGSAEHSLVAMYRGEIVDKTKLPIRFLGYSTSFRREVDSYGKDTQGIFRMHHFDKLEMESLSTKEQAIDEHKLFIGLQEHLMQRLGLHYHVLLKCTADIGDTNVRGVDIEAWFPSQQRFRETHTADYMGDYQARRLGIRFKNDAGETEFVHTNDATAFAMGRTMIAIMEQYQQKDGTVKIPPVLQKYYGAEVL